MWRRVAEDFAPFDVDVTTEDPGYAAVNRADLADTTFGTTLLVTNSVSNCANGRTLYASLCPGGCGGLAYVGVFDDPGPDHDYFQPAIVFQNGTNGTNGYPKFTAEAASHEVGHTVGLSHDGTAGLTYYGGHGSWAPIMGVSYDFPISQWSKGEYAGATNTEDDFAVAGANGLPPAPDDHGDTDATGVINLTTKRGRFRNEAEAGLRVDNLGSLRMTTDISRVLVDRRLALRLNLLDSDLEGWHENTARNLRAVAGALRWQPFEIGRAHV